MLTRLNPRGLKFILTSLAEQETRISWGDKSIDVNFDIRRLNQSWYDWAVKGHYIQVCFPYLSPEQRDFLLTGLTPEEQAKMWEGVDD